MKTLDFNQYQIDSENKKYRTECRTSQFLPKFHQQTSKLSQWEKKKKRQK